MKKKYVIFKNIFKNSILESEKKIIPINKARK